MSQVLKRGVGLRHESYIIERLLGQGGFGITYLATDLSLDRRVAIKEFFSKDYCDRNGESTTYVTLGTSSTEEMVSTLKAKFIKEAKNIAKLDHPGIVKIHTAFEENNTAYYVMDYIEGRSLSEIVKTKGPLSVRQAIDIMNQVGKAIEYIHSHKINHLDIKPANIMIKQSDQHAILIDFGLSKQYDNDGNQTSTSAAGVSHGFSPLEQYKAGGVAEFSPQTDVYSLVATLYYIVSGKIPPHATDIIEEGITFPEGFPASLQQIIRLGMATSRKDRYGNVGLFLEDLNRVEIDQDETQVLEVELIDSPKAETEKENAISTPHNYSQNRITSSNISANYIYQSNPPSYSNPNYQIQDVEISEEESGKKSRTIFFIIGSLIIVLAALLFILISTGNDNDDDSEILSEGAVERVVDLAIPTSIGTAKYSGEVDADEKPHGKGIATWTEGKALQYDGEWVHGKMEGETKYTLRNGDVFEGTFKDNKYSEGKYTIQSTGDYFEGSFKNEDVDKGAWYDKSGKKTDEVK